VLDKNASSAMNTGSSFASRRQVVFAANRILVSYEAGAAPYEGNTPMAVFRLVSIDVRTGAVKNTKEFVGKWGSTPYLYSTKDEHVIYGNWTLTKLNPDLSESGPRFAPDHGRAIYMSPDGSTIAWETTPGTTLIDASTLTPTDRRLTESVPTSVSTRAVVTDNSWWIRDFPKDKGFVTLIDEKEKRLLYHGACGGRPEFLNDERVFVAGCGKIWILDLQGKILRETEKRAGEINFAGVSRNGRRFAVAYSDGSGDPFRLTYEYFVIYDTETAQEIAVMRVKALPERQSWSALSPDGTHFVVGNQYELNLYRLP
jgi:hypothetical protein